MTGRKKLHYLFSVTRWTCFSALVLSTTAIGLNVMAEDYASHLKLDKNAEASEAFSVEGSKNLNFHAVKIDGVRWFNEDRTLSVSYTHLTLPTIYSV